MDSEERDGRIMGAFLQSKIWEGTLEAACSSGKELWAAGKSRLLLEQAQVSAVPVAMANSHSQNQADGSRIQPCSLVCDPTQ